MRRCATDARSSYVSVGRKVCQRILTTKGAGAIYMLSKTRAGQVAHIRCEEPYRIYRDAGAVVTGKGKANPQAQPFVDFLTAPEGRAIFMKWGWKTD
ncbi:substrate-binding domain-containing protein [Achromobacter sp. HZ01]|uniref:substrate-binding domain-containing protein n=1 Tax=Achromobacter sp. HZ01 TaxID=1416886 RepID=UPI0032B2B758